MITPISASLHTNFPFVALAEAPKTSTCKKVMLVFSMFFAAAAVASAFVLHLIAGAVVLVPAAFAIRAAYKALSIKTAPDAPKIIDPLSKAFGNEAWGWNKPKETEKRNRAEFIGGFYLRNEAMFPRREKLADGNTVLQFSCLFLEEGSGSKQVTAAGLITDSPDRNPKWGFVREVSEFEELVADYEKCASEGLMEAVVYPLIAARGEPVTFTGKTKTWKLQLALPVNYVALDAALAKGFPKLEGIKEEDNLRYGLDDSMTADRMQGVLPDGRQFVAVRCFGELHQKATSAPSLLLASPHSPPAFAVKMQSVEAVSAVKEGEDWTSWRFLDRGHGIIRGGRYEEVWGPPLLHLLNSDEVFTTPNQGDTIRKVVIAERRENLERAPGRKSWGEVHRIPDVQRGSISKELSAIAPVTCGAILEFLKNDLACSKERGGRYEKGLSLLIGEEQTKTFEFNARFTVRTIGGLEVHTGGLECFIGFDRENKKMWQPILQVNSGETAPLESFYYATGVNYEEQADPDTILRLAGGLLAAPNRRFILKDARYQWEFRMVSKNGFKEDLERAPLLVPNKNELTHMVKGLKNPITEKTFGYVDGRVFRALRHQDPTTRNYRVFCAIEKNDGTYDYLPSAKEVGAAINKSGKQEDLDAAFKARWIQNY
jgi:hypothetical protein